MTPEEFVKVVRSGNEKLRVDNVIVNAGPITLRGRGVLVIQPEKHLRIELTLRGRAAPPTHNRVITKKDAWSLTGIIDEHLRFRCDNVSPGGNWSAFNGPTNTVRIVLSRLKRHWRIAMSLR